MSQAHETRRVRGHILSTLLSFYPNSVTGGVVFRDVLEKLFPALEWVEALRQLAYLQERGFIEEVPDFLGRSRSARETWYWATARGLDVASGVLTDDAIDMEL